MVSRKVWGVIELLVLIFLIIGIFSVILPAYESMATMTAPQNIRNFFMAKGIVFVLIPSALMFILLLTEGINNFTAKRVRKSRVLGVFEIFGAISYLIGGQLLLIIIAPCILIQAIINFLPER